MSYSKEHKKNTRVKILENAKRLFSFNGYNGVTIDDVMKASELTRGGFYAHFSSKSELYQEALKYSVSSSELFQLESAGPDKEDAFWEFVESYLGVGHLSGEIHCPLAFLVHDVAIADKGAREVYEEIYKKMNMDIINYLGREKISEKESYAMTAMIIGAVAIARSMDDYEVGLDVMSSAKNAVNKFVKGF